MSKNDNISESALHLTKEFIQDRLQNDKIHFYFHAEQKRLVYNLFERTISKGESNIALLIGSRGCGKTTLVTSVLYSIICNAALASNNMFVRLHGLVDTDDIIALKSITNQLQLENESDGKVFTSFADKLLFLLNCLKTGRESGSKSIIFILEDFHLFCNHKNQTLLYNLFDAAQSAQAPICVIGLTDRLDVMELFEKRVKSRFSHRQIFIFPRDISFSDQQGVIKQLLSLPTPNEIKSESKDLEKFMKNNKLTWMRRIFNPSSYKFSNQWVKEWNSKVDSIMKNSAVIESFQFIYDVNTTLAVIKVIIYQIITDLKSSHLDVHQIQKMCKEYYSDDQALTLAGLSVLEICLLIAFKHHWEIYDQEPFNFEIILTRLNKFIKSSRRNAYDRSVVLKAFEQLMNRSFISPLTDSSSKAQKEFKMYKLNILVSQINDAVSKYPNLPTEISRWAQSSLNS